MSKILSYNIACAAALFVPTAIAAQTRPNIILFLVDDMGWQDTSVPFYNDTKTPLNQRFRTPNMERLAQMGVRFTSAYACAVSSPSRCSLMSGMNAARHRVTNWTLHYDTPTDDASQTLRLPEWNYNGIQPDTVRSPHNTAHATPITSLPQILHNNGYYTIHCGKAHFGAESTPGENPATMGFDVNIAGGANGAPASYLGKENFGKGAFHVRGLEAYEGTDIFLTEALTIEAQKSMDKALAQKRPFYLYMSHYAVHAPYSKDARFVDNYLGKYDEALGTNINASEARYDALVEGMDKSLGDLLDYVQRRGIGHNTIILFMSDNGGQALSPRQGTPNTQNLPARAGKGSANEGGVHEPMMVYVPGLTKGGTVNANTVSIEDFFPTILDMAGISRYKTVQTVDGISFLPLLRNPQKRRSRPLYWHFPNLWGESQDRVNGYGASSSILKDGYRLIYFWQTQTCRLYNLNEDFGETRDLSATEPRKAKALAKALTRFLKKVDAQRPALLKTGRLIPYPDGSER